MIALRPIVSRCSWLVAGVLLIAAAPASAAVSFAPAANYPAGAQPIGVVIGDFNRDGLLDVATADKSSGSVAVLLATGLGALGSAATYPVGGAPEDVATGDFDRDGILDLALADNRGHVAVLRGLAGGTFAAAQIVQVSGSATQVAVGDVNGDGLDDLVSSDTTSVPGDVSIELGDGAGGFAATLVQNARGAPAQLALADVNGDLRADVITADGGMKSVSVLLGNADGTIGPLRSFAVGGMTSGLAIGNFNADGNPDIAVGHMSRVVTVLLGDGRGGFPTQNDFETLFVQQFALATADFDADGRVDLAASGSGFNILRGTGTGAFESATAHGFGALALAVGDLNNDTAPDVVGTQAGNVVVRLNTSTAGARPLPQPTVAETANVQPVKGTVLVRQPGSKKFLRLKRGDQIPVGSLVDTTRGSVAVTSAAGGGRVQSAVFRAGLFRLGQTRGPKPITEVRLASPLHCGAAGHKGATKRPLLRRLFGRGHGRFRTRGRHSIASIRGTEWLVKDTCASTTTVSLHGTVVVNDLLKHRTVTLRTGQRYIARRGNR